MPGSVRLAAKESRDLELIVIDLVMHRGCPSVLVEALRNAPLGVFGDCFLAARISTAAGQSRFLQLVARFDF